MPDPLADLPPRFLHTKEAAYFLGLSRRTMEKHRTYGTGPVYRKVGAESSTRSAIRDPRSGSLDRGRRPHMHTGQGGRHGLSPAPADTRRTGPALNAGG